MAKLGQQIKGSVVDNLRKTRTQRLKEQQEIQKFNLLRQKAQQIQQTSFQDRTYTETYSELIPSEFNINDYTRNKWYSKPDYVRDRYIKNAQREGGSLDTIQKTRQVTIPFTIEDSSNSYRSVYETLSPDVKQFFDTPEEALVKKQQRIAQTRTQIEKRKSDIDKQIEELRRLYQDKLDKNELWYESKSDKEKEKYKEQYKQNKRDIENKLDQKLAELTGQKEGYDVGLKELGKNRELEFSIVEDYARDIGRNQENIERSRNEQKIQQNIQLEKIRKLEGAGYKPYLVEQIGKSGKTETSTLTYYNPEKNKFEKIQTFDTPSKIETSGLKRLGTTGEGTKSINYLGKEYNFKTRTGVYVDSAGDIVTTYGKTGFTEAGLIQEARDQAIKEQEERLKKDARLNQFVTLKAGEELPIGYGSQGTATFDYQGNVQTPSVLMPYSQYEKIKAGEEKKTGIIGYSWDKIKSGLKWADDRVYWKVGISDYEKKPFETDFRLGIPIIPFVNKLDLIGIGKNYEYVGGATGDKLNIDYYKVTPTNIQKYWMGGKENIATAKSIVDTEVIGEERLNKFNKETEEKYSSIYQAEFEREYGARLINEEIKFDDAVAEFQESDKYKDIQKRYGEEYAEGYKELQTFTKNPFTTEFWNKNIRGGIAQYSLSLAELGLKATETPLRAVGTGVAVYTGVKAFSLIPPAVNYAILGTTGTYGVLKTFDPKSTYMESGAGFVTATLSFGALGYQAYKYWKSPVVKRVKTKQPSEASLKSSQTIGEDIKIKNIEKSVIQFEKQKLSQQVTQGYRTIVTTKGRVFTNRFWKRMGVPDKFTSLDSNAIYRGVPTEQLARTYTLRGFRGNYKITIGKSGYQQAKDLLKKYGYTESQAVRTLRYTAPRVYNQYSTGVLVQKGDYSRGFSLTKVERPIISVDKELGIKTRGGGTTLEYTQVQRKLLGQKGDSSFILEGKESDLYSISRGRLTLKQATRELNLVKSEVSDLKIGYTPSKIQLADKDIRFLDRMVYRDVYGESATLGRTTIKFGKNINIKNEIADIVKGKPVDLKVSRSSIIQERVGGKLGKINLNNYKFQALNDFDDSNLIRIDLSKSTVSSNSAESSARVLEKLDSGKQFTGSKQTSIEKNIDKTVGTQQEFKLVELSKTQKFDEGLTLKQRIIPSDISVQSVKSILKIKNISSTINALVPVSSTALKPALKPLMKPLSLKELLKKDLKMKQIQSPTLKMSQVSLQKSLNLKLNLSPLAQFNIKSPKPVTPKLEIPFTPIPFNWDEIKQQKQKKNLVEKKLNEFAYLPDFSSRIIGLDPLQLSEKQALKKVKQLQTGLEIRRGAVIR